MNGRMKGLSVFRPSRARSGQMQLPGRTRRSPSAEHPMTQTAETRSPRSVPQREDAAFNWEDPLDLEGEITEEERMVRDTARGYAQDKLMPRVLTAYREERVDTTILPEM